MNEFKAEELKIENKNEIIELFLKKEQISARMDQLKQEMQKILARLSELLADKKVREAKGENK